MTKEYLIQGMTCGGCVSSVKKSLESLHDVEEATIQLAAPQGKLTLSRPVKIETLQQSIGHYKIQEVTAEPAKKK